MVSDLNLLKVFLKVAELGSFTQAAHVLKQPKSRVSRSIARLETELNSQLIRRTTRSMHLTTAGRDLQTKISGPFARIQSDLKLMMEDSQEIQGILRVTTPEDLGHMILTPLLIEFSKRHPDLQFDIVITNSFLDLTRHDIDVAIRVGQLKDSSFIAKKLGQVELVFVATPDYLAQHGTPKNVQELHNHPVFLFNSDNYAQIFQGKNTHLTLKPKLSANSFLSIYNWVIQGLGVGLLPNFFCRDAIHQEVLTRITLPALSPPVTIQLLYHANRKNLPVRARLFIDFLSSKIPKLLLVP